MNARKLLPLSLGLTIATSLGIACGGGIPSSAQGSPSPVLPSSEQARPIATEIPAPVIYRDKNGYFSFVPPRAWTMREYTDDPRSKVEFSHPSSPGIRLRLIAALAPSHMNQGNFVGLMRQDMETMRQRLGSIVKSVELEEETFASFNSASIRMSTTEGAQELTLFLADGLFFNMSYEAPDSASLAENQSIVDQSLGTLLVRKPSSASEEQVREQRLARYLRLAKLMSEAGEFDLARQSLEDGLIEYPGDPVLLKAIESVNMKMVPE